MGNTPSVTIDPAESEEATAQALLPYYQANPDKFQKIIAHLEVASRSTKPKFPAKASVKDINPVPETDHESFKSAHINMDKLDYDHPEAVRRFKVERTLQYQRWEWACNNLHTYVNMLRLSGFTDEKIQAMIEGTPLCFESPEAYREMRVALKKLSNDISQEMGWRNVSFVITGSSVAGFSQNPLKGFAVQPSRITCAKSSDVDICIVASGVNQTMIKRIKAGHDEPKRSFVTTCSPTTSSTRFGLWDISAVSKCVHDFHKTWDEKLPGGLQFTFSEDENPTPPWETRIDIIDV